MPADAELPQLLPPIIDSGTLSLPPSPEAGSHEELSVAQDETSTT